MYHCPGCAGQMVYDIPSGMLKCRSCDRTETVPDMEKLEAAHAGNGMQGYCYTCPNCGGSLFSVETTATTFCSFCGSSVMLEQRIMERERPDRIIPFAVTKEQCIEKFRDYVRKGSFVDRKMLENAAADSFRGIYIPYRNYQTYLNGKLSAEVTETHGNTDYVYRVDKQISVEDDWILHDLSQALPDDHSARINEFSRDDSREFLPGYMAGFYADIPDVDPAVYHSEVRTETADRAVDAFKENQSGSISDTAKLRREAFEMTRIIGEESVLLPVWFMCVRNGDRVCYAIVNGVTGKVTSDLPVDRKRVYLTAGIAAVVLFLFLFFAAKLTLKPQITVTMASVMLAAVCGIVSDQNRELNGRDTELERLAEASETARQGNLTEKVESKKIKGIGKGIGSFLFIGTMILALVLGTSVGNSLTNILALYGTANKGLMVLICGVAALITGLFVFMKNPGRKLSGLVAFALNCGAVLMQLINRPEDTLWWAYAVIMLLCGVWCETEMIRIYNIACTRHMPVFDTHQGGEDRA